MAQSYFENGISGILVANRNVEEMKNAILLLAGHEYLRKTLGRAGREFVKNKFNPIEETRKLCDIYERL